ncbi:MAG: acylphosphatase [Candidatus Bathyarchaeia archaeon]
MPNARAHVYVSGRVQGVFFRQHTKSQAQNHGVTGWVRNVEDGGVEAVFEGEDSAVKALVEYCHHGPRSALVTKVSVDWEPFRGEFQNFSVIY